MKKFSLIVCLSSALLLTSGCHPISVQTGYDRSVHFAGRRMYAWRTDSKLDTGDPRFDTQRMDRDIRSAVDTTLAAKGFQKTDSASPDFLVGYAANVEFGTSTVTYQRTFIDLSGDWTWTGSHSDTADYETGALLLEIKDPATERSLWRAVASAVVIKRATAVERRERIGKAVRKMLDDFPPQ